MPSDGEPHERYEVATSWDVLVANYARLSLSQVDALGLADWLLLRRDAFIERLRTTARGSEWLDNAWRLSQVDMDSAGLRSEFGSSNG